MKMQLALLALVASVSSRALVHRHHQHQQEELVKRDYIVYTTITVHAAATANVNVDVSAGAAPTSAPASTFTAQPGTAQPTAACTTCQQGAPAAAAPSGSSGSSGSSANLPSGSGGGFTDGTIPCSQFPSNVNGIVALDWLNLGGWSGIQSGNAAGSSCSQEGDLCSYACAPGMAKTQWPANQPADGQSRGGLICKGGMLYRTRPDVPDLCMMQAQTASIVNNLNQEVAVCQTDYPGSENMVIPTVTSASNTSPLTCINEASYYQWQGKPTSGQFYVQSAGVGASQGCIWGTAGSNIGNFSPLNFGAGQSNGLTYLSLIPNPNGDISQLGYNVKIVADSGSTINGNCGIENGAYTGGANGCTVTVTSGSAHFLLY